ERGLDAARLDDPPNDEHIARLYVALAETLVPIDPVRAKDWAIEASIAGERAGGLGLVAAAAASMWSVFNTTIVGAVGGDRWLFELCQRAIDIDGDADPAVRARVLATYIQCCVWLREDVEASLVDEAVELARSTGDPAAIVMAACARLNIEFLRGPRRE